jgi:penicillin-binding protein 1A
VAVKVQERVGVRRTIDVAHQMGISGHLEPNLSLALGTSDVSLLELTSAYGVLANQGRAVAPTVIRYVTDARGGLLEEVMPQEVEVLSPQIAYVMTQMMRGVVERGTGRAARALGRPAAGKTGSTNDFSNAWFIGFTPSLVTGVWVGYDQPRSLGHDETGGRLAAPIWTTYMKRVLRLTPIEDFPVPDGVTLAFVDLDASNECVRPVPMAFIHGSEPPILCPDSQRRVERQ